jgi:hypothetical protein
MEAVSGEEFIDAIGLDGSCIPFYLQIELGWDNMSIEREIQQDLYSSPKIFNVFPDLDEVDKEDFEEIYKLFDWVLFKHALIERYKACPPRARGKVYTNFSYNEGVWAEELFRIMRRAEVKILLAEQINAMANLAGLDMNRSDEIKKLWEAILKSQHHDISWIEVTDLKRKSINRLKEVIENSDRMMDELTSAITESGDNSVSVFNGQPHSRDAMIELNKGKSLTGYTFQEYDGRAFGFIMLPSGGYQSFNLSDNTIPSRSKPLPELVETDFYTVEFEDNGLIRQLKTKKGDNLLKEDTRSGGEIRARINREWFDNRRADVNYLQGPVCDIVERKSRIKDIPLAETYYFFKNQPFIKVELEFDFNGNEVGYMWFDETKLNVYYPTTGNTVHHDIPFGYKEAKQNRPLLPTNWIECGGFVYVHRGNVKHWVKDGVIANVLAWGDNQFTNRLHWDWIEYTEYDIRLYGKQKIEYYIIPLDDFDGNKVTQLVADIISPVHIQKGNGSKSFYSIDDSGLATTAIYIRNDQIYTRGYKMPEDENDELRDWKIFNRPLIELK